ncbi:3-hydroxyisobutyrate dehydrogenase [Breznakia sp. PH1-1]|nr:3-hydroxyisobutyrate dehydrogenase [Breznakia sp. PH1-1]MDH6405146.1 3-hydroxyisobutyrate dehydrogenase [Breznakia sp. PF1-11]MDH6412865.1 3-hydroxyisobutyrate dehydrogenase [Breznakia sp. PFB1-11]MDH6415222.1 3-hydroxyisobutyrate dehydrogenase [Breznakia sp. PFB1-14]MDH6417536.1 3-hydroxyisobutyrate dehydrogenase [Breznakia sp. PFB1-4]MDH6419898.1 3-hydroxyisobutyrate dehydrogenase [Breznakia sp. PFB1-12]MDH6474961.1 3-hydroxyisobutyrate dehydrogenase [Breznakia sp. PFB2-30]MDH6477276.1 
MKIAWIGTGVMGKAMITNLLQAGYEVHTYNRTYERMDDIDTPFKFKTIKECVENCDVVITMVGYPSDVEEVYFKDGILDYAKEGAILIDMTTSSPDLAKKIANATTKHGVLDAPVSGSDVYAKSGKLTIMVGGNQEDYDKAYPIFDVLGATINLIGSHGAGQHCKMCNQIAIAGAISGVAETITYMKKQGLDPEKVFAAITKGSAQSWQLDNNGPKALKQDFAPGFYIKHFIKDMNIARDEARLANIDLEVLNTVCNMYETLATDGLENDGTQALVKYYESK